jgi:hypothetical protein
MLPDGRGKPKRRGQLMEPVELLADPEKLSAQ